MMSEPGNDTAIVQGEVELIIDKGLLAMLGSVTVDFVEPKGSGCGCGGSCTSCG
ncbi:MAG: hypothetical protein ACOY4W_16345 [Thermodesulfobacteriota bacterium]